MLPRGTLLALIAILTPVGAHAERPNLLFILADDLGWSDTTLHGTTRFYQTPNIERLARRGMTFTRAYAASPLCSPTRASILTGQSPARIGITAPVCHTREVRLEATVAARGPATARSLACQSVTRLKQDYHTLAESLKEAGYVTGHFGKWHLGPEPHDPLHHGFDTDVPHWPGPGPAGSYVAPWRFPNFRERAPGEHIEDRMGDEAVAFIERHRKEPFFLNYWQFSVHAPFDAKPASIEKHRRRVDPRDPQRSPTYAAMVESLDDNVGKLLDALDRLGLAERTAVIFFSDNGGNMYNRIDDTTPTSNAPLRGGKATMYEGGVRVPCIVSWPGVTRAGSRSATPIQSVDFYPTLLDLLGLEPRPGQVFDGINIAPALRGKRLSRDAIFTFFPHGPRVPDRLPPSVSVHRGPWKLIRVFHDGEDQRHRYELYNIEEDIGETKNVAAVQLDRVRELDARIEDFLRSTGAVLPRPNPAYSGTAVRVEAIGVSAMRDCALALRDGHLVIQSTGNDPHLRLAVAKPVPAQSLTLVLRMKSDAPGAGHLYWQEVGVRPAFHRQRRVTFQPRRDGQFHDYRIRFSPGRTITALRLDPAQGRGTITLGAARLVGEKDATLAEWSFAPGAPGR